MLAEATGPSPSLPLRLMSLWKDNLDVLRDSFWVETASEDFKSGVRETQLYKS